MFLGMTWKYSGRSTRHAAGCFPVHNSIALPVCQSSAEVVWGISKGQPPISGISSSSRIYEMIPFPFSGNARRGHSYSLMDNSNHISYHTLTTCLVPQASVWHDYRMYRAYVPNSVFQAPGYTELQVCSICQLVSVGHAESRIRHHAAELGCDPMDFGSSPDNGKEAR